MNALTAITEFASEHSPAIAVGAGLIGFVATIVLACKQTTKLEDILDEAREEEEKIQNFDPEEHPNMKEDYTEEDREKDLKLHRFKTRMKIVRNYAIPAAIGVASIAAILVGFKILHGRYLLVSSAYATLEKAYDTYRGRIRKKYGDEADRYGRTGIERVVEERVDEETGEKVTEEKDILVEAPKNLRDNPFFYLIGPGDYLYDKFGGDMKMIGSQVGLYEREWNRRISNGDYINLNQDILETIFPGDTEKKTDVGQICGVCVLDKETDPNADGYLDLGFGTCDGPSMDGTKEITYGYICPNVSQVSFANINKFKNNFIQNANQKVKVRKGGKYISQ